MAMAKVPLNIRIDEEVKERAAERATVLGQSLTTFVVRALEAALERIERAEKR